MENLSDILTIDSNAKTKYSNNVEIIQNLNIKSNNYGKSKSSG